MATGPEQGDMGVLYSPTSPLDPTFLIRSSGSMPDQTNDSTRVDESQRDLVLDLPVSASLFMGKRRRDGLHTRS